MSNGYELFAAESTYDTAPASGWRELEVMTDGHKTRQDILQFTGIRRNASAPSVAGRRIIAKGAEGSIEVPGYDSGLGLFMRAAATTATTALHASGTLSNDQTYKWAGGGPAAGNSIATEIYRDRKSGTVDAFTYTGGKVTETEITQDLSEHLMFKFSVDYATSKLTTPTPSRTPVSVEPDFIYAWPDALITLTPEGGSPTSECLSSFSVTLPNALDVDDWCLKRGTNRHEPSRQGTPEPAGKLEWKYQDPKYFAAFMAGTVFGLTASWEGVDFIEGAIKPSLTITIPAIVFTGEDPEISADAATTQSLPFVILDNGTDPACTIVAVTTDTGF